MRARALRSRVTGAVVDLRIVPSTHRKHHATVHVLRHLVEWVQRWVPSIINVSAVSLGQCGLYEALHSLTTLRLDHI